MTATENLPGLISGAPAGPPRAILSQDLIGPGLCRCLISCECEWGLLIGGLQWAAHTGYIREVVIALPDLHARAVTTIAAQRRKWLQQLASQWDGTVESFLAEYQLKRTTYDKLGLKILKENRR